MNAARKTLDQIAGHFQRESRLADSSRPGDGDEAHLRRVLGVGHAGRGTVVVQASSPWIDVVVGRCNPDHRLRRVIRLQKNRIAPY